MFSLSLNSTEQFPRSILVRHARFPRDMLASDMLAMMHEDATSKLLPWNLSITEQPMFSDSTVKHTSAVQRRII